MKYPKEYLNEIKLRLKVSQIVGKTVQLKKEEKNLLGFSPFKNEKAYLLQLMMKRNFIIVLVAGNMGTFLIF